MLKLKLQHFGLLMQRADSLEKTLMLGKIEGRRRRVQQRTRWLDDIADSMDMCLSKLRVGNGQGGLACCSAWGLKESDTTEWLNWTALRRQWDNIFKVLKEKNGHLEILNPVKLSSRMKEKLRHSQINNQRRWWHSTPVLLPGKSHARRSLAGYSP